MLDAIKAGGAGARVQKICGPQIFVIQQPSMFLSTANGTANAGKSTIVFTNSASGTSNSNVRNILSLASSNSVPKVQLLSRPSEPMLRPKTLKRPLTSFSSVDSMSASASVSSLSDDDIDVDVDSKDQLLDEERKVRKRANLDHLTVEEKLMRRKLKNRVAAQNARDKKRMKMEEMEETIKRLEDHNRQLAIRNNKLEKENKALAAENKKLSANNNNTNVNNNNKNNIDASDLSVKVEEEEVDMFAPFTPDSLSTPGSDFEEDSDSSGFVSGGFESRSLVDSRFRVPAERTESGCGSGPGSTLGVGDVAGTEICVGVGIGIGASTLGSLRLASPSWASPSGAATVGLGLEVRPSGLLDDEAAHRVELAAEETKPLVGQPSAESASQDLKIGFGEISSTTSTMTTKDLDMVDDIGGAQLIDNLFFELDQHSAFSSSSSSPSSTSTVTSPLDTDISWESSFEQLFPDLI